MDDGLFPFTGTIESVALECGDVKEPTGMERLEMATKMDCPLDAGRLIRETSPLGHEIS
jgi:hypothetical protein